MTITNVITAGDYKGYIDFKNAKKGLYIYGAFGLGKKTFINKDTVHHYEVIGEETYTSFGSSVTRGIRSCRVRRCRRHCRRFIRQEEGHSHCLHRF